MFCHRLFNLFFFFIILFSYNVLSHKHDLLRDGSDSEDENAGNFGTSSQAPSSCMHQGIAWTARGVLGTAQLLNRTATVVAPYMGAAVKATASGTRWAFADHVAPRLATLYRDTLVPGALGAWRSYLVPGTRQVASTAYNRVARPLVQKGARAALRVLDPSWKTAAERARELQQNSPQENGEMPQKNEAEEILRENVQEVRPVQQKKVRWKDQQGQLTNGQEVRQVNENEAPLLLPESSPSFSGFSSSSSSSNSWEDGNEIEQKRQKEPAVLVSQQITETITDINNHLVRRKQSAGKQPAFDQQEWLPKPSRHEIEMIQMEPKKKWWNLRGKRRNQIKSEKKLQ